MDKAGLAAFLEMSGQIDERCGEFYSSSIGVLRPEFGTTFHANLVVKAGSLQLSGMSVLLSG